MRKIATQNWDRMVWFGLFMKLEVGMVRLSLIGNLWMMVQR